MKAFFNELFEYCHIMNQKLIDAYIANQDKVSDKAELLLCHLLNAHQTWNNRICQKEHDFGVWQLHNSEDLKNIDRENYLKTLEILEQYEIDQKVTYTNLKGQTFSNSIRDILFHVINHSTYHRGQIASEFKQCGIDPIVSDFIFYSRKEMPES
jgi:uncharacterized damage-inducible protein DinB